MNQRSKYIQVLAPLVLLVVLLTIWQIVCVIFKVSENLLPKPTEILLSLQKNFFKVIFPDMLTSLQNMLIGYLIAVPLGFLIAALASQFKFVVRMITPVLIILMVTPMATLVPEFKLFLGVSPMVKVLIIILQCAPVIAVNSITGFMHVPQNKLDVMRALGCGRWETFFRVTIPNALPQVFIGLKLGCILCTIAAMSADLSVGQGGLGYRISISASQRATDTAYATILVAAIIGVLLYNFVSFIERKVITWK
ncbi:MAG: ABC transporter permease [Lachnospiraceae bacterium]